MQSIHNIFINTSSHSPGRKKNMNYLLICFDTNDDKRADTSEPYLFLLLSSQLHLLLLLLQQQGGHVPLLGVGPQELLPQAIQLVDHHQQLELFLS